ncbi:MAG: hypothetical protein NVSMB13_11810 [Mycobacteriales bacterium]
MQAGGAAARSAAEAATGCLRDGTAYLLRPLESSQRALLVEGFGRLSAESRYRRFLAPVPRLSARMLHRLVDHVDGINHVATVLVVRPGADDEEPVAIARFIREQDHPERAEYAITVVDEWQGRGAGSVLSDALVRRARELGVRIFTASVHAENAASLRLLARAGELIDRHSEGPGVLEVAVALRDPAG